MSTTITIRADESLRSALQMRAAEQGKTVSEIVREILEEALMERTVAARAGHLKGKLRLSGGTSDSWRRRIREHNWRS